MACVHAGLWDGAILGHVARDAANYTSMSITIIHPLSSIVVVRPPLSGWQGVELVVELPAAMVTPTSTPSRYCIVSATCWVCDTFRPGLAPWSIEPRCGDIMVVLGTPMVPWVGSPESAGVTVAIRDARIAQGARKDARAMGAVPIVLAVPA